MRKAVRKIKKDHDIPYVMRVKIRSAKPISKSVARHLKSLLAGSRRLGIHGCPHARVHFRRGRRVLAILADPIDTVMAIEFQSRLRYLLRHGHTADGTASALIPGVAIPDVRL